MARSRGVIDYIFTGRKRASKAGYDMAICGDKNWHSNLLEVFKITGVLAHVIFCCENHALAQITPDRTLGNNSSKITPNVNIKGSAADRIDGGAIRGANLFHSFQEFNVGESQRVYFANPTGIKNILTRVTGSNISNILGTLGVNGGANLFLINPNGILFGSNARLDVAGSFVGTTANSLLFPNGLKFSATNPQDSSLLTINIPIGLQFGKQQPGEITLQGQPSSELRVTPGRSLVLAGGQIGVNQFKLFAPGGRIELAGVAGEGRVDLKVDGNDVGLSLPDNIARADASLKNAELDTEANGGGGIKIDTRNLDLLNSSISSKTNGRGDAGSILLQSTGSIFFRNSGIDSVTYGEGNSGNISLKTNGSISFDTSSISTSTPSGLGDAGSISLKANGSISFVGGGIFSDAHGRGAGGGISLEAGDSILITKEVTFDSEAISDRSGAGSISFKADNSIVISDKSSIYSNSSGKGDAGKISVQAYSFSLLNGSQLVSTTFGEGKGGDIEINTADAVNISGLYPTPVYPDATLLEYSSIRSSANSGATNKAGDIRIKTKTLQLSDAAVLNAGTSSSAMGGNITIDTHTLEIEGGAKLLTSTFGFDGGNAGNIIVNAIEKIDIVGSDLNYFEQQQRRSYLPLLNDQISPASGLFSNTTPDSNGNGGTIHLSTPALLLADGAQVVTSTVGSGKAGDIYLGSSDKPIEQITISGANTGFFASTQASAVTLPLKFTTVAEIGEAGQLPSTAQTIPTVAGIFVEKISGSLDTTNDVDLYQIELQGNQTFSATTTFLSQVSDTRLFLFDSNGFGVYANDDTIFPSFASYQSSLPSKHPLTPKNPGTYYLGITQYPVTAVSNGGEIFSFRTFGEISGATGQGGSLPLSGWVGNGFEQNKYTILLSGLTAVPQILPGGDSGNITVHAGSLTVKDSAQLTASTTGSGKAGNIQVNVNSLNVSSGGQLLSNTSSNGQAGNITINAASNINFSDPGSGLYANTTPGSTGKGGNIFIDPRTLTIQDSAKIAVDSQGEGIGGNIKLAAGFLTLDKGTISAETHSNTGGNITLNVQNLLLLRNGSKISTSAGNNEFDGDGGNITINSPFIVAVPKENSDITANAFTGSGGRVDITTNGIFGILPQKNPTENSDITASSELGVSGEVSINSPDTDPSRGLIQLPSNLVDASQQIAQGCTPRRRQNASSFIATGRGGLPQSPNEPLRGRAVITGWVDLPPQATAITDKLSTSVTKSTDQIVEAQGWIVDANGDVILVAQSGQSSSIPSAISCSQ
ncbi:two-partner secretion domain-containing protein [Nostoc sp.]|uniref:two-partner secretion domain-containing protein n=1 Tax=Nostoc sp. TaxID=1180 RepID=UPI002FFA2ACC